MARKQHPSQWGGVFLHIFFPAICSVRSYLQVFDPFRVPFRMWYEDKVQLHSRACGHQHCLLEMPSGRKATGPERGTERGQKESVGGRTEVQSVGERRTRRSLRGSKSAAHHPPREKVPETSSGWRQNCLLSCWARVQSQTPGYRRQF